MKKVLFVAHVESHILHFHIPYLKMFHEKGYKVHVATNGESDIPYCDVKHNLPFQKSPFKKDNYKAYKELKKILNEEKFEIIHCHTPVGGVVARLANRFSVNYKTTRMIYTAHGFHFYKGAPISYWMIFYPIERWLAHYTDTLITINQEDYDRASEFHLKKNGNVEFVHGVGVDEEKFNFIMSDEDKINFRKELGIEAEDFIMIFSAELNKNKNQIFLINAMKEIVKSNKNVKLLLPGKDLLNGEYQKIVKEENLCENIKFLGYRKDIPKLLKISDLAVSSSKREGLPVNLIEASICGLPLLVSDCRGNKELGDVYKNKEDFIRKVINCNLSLQIDWEKYSLKNVKSEYKNIYFKKE